MGNTGNVGNSSWFTFPALYDHLQFTYQRNFNSTLGWTKVPMYAACQPATLFYVSTHSDASSFWTDSNDMRHPPGSGGFEEWIFAHTQSPEYGYMSSFEGQGLPAVGTGTPPYNTGTPTMTLAFVQACLFGQTNSLGNVLLRPYTNVFNAKLCENQAFCGYQIGNILNRSERTSEAFWYALQMGYTVDNARDKAFLAYFASEDPVLEPEEFMRVWGDHAMRLNNVYTEVNDDTRSTEWFRWWKLEAPS